VTRKAADGTRPGGIGEPIPGDHLPSLKRSNRRASKERSNSALRSEPRLENKKENFSRFGLRTKPGSRELPATASRTRSGHPRNHWNRRFARPWTVSMSGRRRSPEGRKHQPGSLANILEASPHVSIAATKMILPPRHKASASGARASGEKSADVAAAPGLIWPRARSCRRETAGAIGEKPRDVEDGITKPAKRAA